MKALWILTTLGALSLPARAVPVFNENASNSPHVTMYPDHADPNLLYIAPNYLEMVVDENDVPEFSYIEYREGGVFSKKKAVVQTLLRAAYHTQEIDEAREALLAKNPNLRFSPVPFVASKIVFGDILKDFVTARFCDHPAGLVGDLQACNFELGDKGVKVFRNTLRKRATLLIQFEYTMEGLARQADKTFNPATRHMSIAVRIGGPELLKHPELFVDERGRPLPW